MNECKFCNTDMNNVPIVKNYAFEVEVTDFKDPTMNIYFDDTRGFDGSIGSISVSINYCPICGRKFERG